MCTILTIKARATRVNFFTVCSICRSYKLREGDYRANPWENVGGQVSFKLHLKALAYFSSSVAPVALPDVLTPF